MPSPPAAAPRARPAALPPIPALLLAAVSIQGGAALAKSIFPLLGPPAVTGLRVTFAAVILGLIWRVDLRRVTGHAWRTLLPYGVSLGLMNLSYYLALERIPLGLTVTLEFVGPLAVAVLSSRRASDFAWVALAALGLLLIVPWPGQVSALDPVGIVLALVAGACWGVYIWAGQRVAQVFAGPQGVALGMGIAALTTLPFAAVMGAQHGAWSHLTPAALVTALGVAVLSSALPYSLEMGALRALPARVFGVLMSLEPAVAGLIGMVFLGEHLKVLQWLAIACVIAASVGVTLNAGRRAPPPVDV
ncbi:EamA family transporter [Deinococcus aquiradiocola]|uniref:EamA family transporter n=1 Tax=Deinococcus aquiradiocola TaxID=393059 RepID=UPI001E344F66|nr:DMT family transporter [Deinococcus aquiradiocola]